MILKYRKNLFWLLASLIVLIVFYLFSLTANSNTLKDIDFAVTVKVQERIDKSSRLRLQSLVSNTIEGATFFASPEFSVFMVGILTIVYFYDKKRKKIRWSSVVIPIMFGLLVLGEVYGKNVVHHPSPPFFMLKNPTTIFPKYYINDQFSYPSGHTARAVFLGITISSLFMIHISFFKKKKMNLIVGTAIFFYIVTVALGQIYLGHHWLSDIIGGALLGLGFGLLTLASISPIIDKQ